MLGIGNEWIDVRGSPWTLPRLLRHKRIESSSECLYIRVKRISLNASANARKEIVQDVQIVDLQQNPCKHLFRVQQMLDVRSMVLRTRITSAALAER